VISYFIKAIIAIMPIDMFFQKCVGPIFIFSQRDNFRDFDLVFRNTYFMFVDYFFLIMF